jgi:CRP-like cAMP-binding protein
MSTPIASIAIPPDTGTPHAEKRCDLPAGSELTAADAQRLWSLKRGVLAVYDTNEGSHGSRPCYLARPGDLIGAECLAGEPSPGRVTVLAAASLVAIPRGTLAQRQGLLAQAYGQARRQAREFVQLRSGSLTDRVRHLLLTLGSAHGEEVDLELPPLRQLAGLLDATPEAICRVMGGLKHLDVLVTHQYRHARVLRRALSDLVPPPGLSSGLSGRRPAVRPA